jgi:hypothetical protein
MRLPLFAAAALTLLACAGRPPAAPTSALEGDATERAPVAGDALEHEPATATANANANANATASSSVAKDEPPPANLVCRSVGAGGGETELFLDWAGSEATGVLREVAPSGMVHEKKVRAERHDNVVIADDIYEKDLVNHAAIVGERGGKKVMKVDDSWSRCE